MALIPSIAQKTLGLEEPPVDSSVVRGTEISVVEISEIGLDSKFAKIFLPFSG